MRLKKLADKKWYNGAVVACIGVAFYVLLTNFQAVWTAVGGFLGNFRAIFLGIVFAYVINPLAKFFHKRFFGKKDPGGKYWIVSVCLAFLAGLLAVLLLIGLLIPQLIQSLTTFLENFEGYAATFTTLLEKSGIQSLINEEQLRVLSQNALTAIQNFVKDNAGRLLSSAANSGKQILSTVIALILAIYLLMNKAGVVRGTKRLIRALMRRETSEGFFRFLSRCDSILMSFIGQSLLESVIVGAINAVFMAACGMQYVGLVSVVVGLTNLVPNFGPAIGAALGGFILVLVRPVHALMFLIFTAVLQTVDGYILKPKLFSGSLGVSGLLILAASVVFGNLFGILGVLLSIPLAAILSFVYKDYLLSKWEARRRQLDAEEKGSAC